MKCKVPCPQKSPPTDVYHYWPLIMTDLFLHGQVSAITSATFTLSTQKNDYDVFNKFENWPINQRLCNLNFFKNVYVFFPILDYSQLSTDYGFITLYN